MTLHRGSLAEFFKLEQSGKLSLEQVDRESFGWKIVMS